MEHTSGVGVLDKAVAVLDVVEAGPVSLAGLVARSGLSRATAHRLAVALESHRMLARDSDGRFVLGPRLLEMALAVGDDPLTTHAQPVLTTLRDATGESAQLYVRRGEGRVCVAAVERGHGLRDTVPVGAVLPMSAGSAAQVLVAWLPADQQAAMLADSAYSRRTLAEVRRRGWAHSVGEREAGVASVSAPVRGRDGQVVAAISISGPAERLGRAGGHRAPGVVQAGLDLARRMTHG